MLGDLTQPLPSQPSSTACLLPSSVQDSACLVPSRCTLVPKETRLENFPSRGPGEAVALELPPEQRQSGI